MEGNMTDHLALDYQLEGVPPDLVQHIQQHQKLREALLKMEATGMRLVRMEAGWSNPRGGERTDQAFAIEILSRPGRENDTSAGPWGQCFAFLKGTWHITQISQC